MIRIKLCIAATLMVVAAAVAADATYLMAKASLAQHLIARAWDQSLASGGLPHRPWPWADTVVVARLKVPAAALDTRVLDGSHGTALAFGPGMTAGSVAPGEQGLIVIGAHRDTHFNHLHKVVVDDIIRLQDAKQQWHEYRVSHIYIADIRHDQIAVDHSAARLLLVTCYPFDAILPGGPLRYVIEAQLQPS
jgi:sortase A